MHCLYPEDSVFCFIVLDFKKIVVMKQEINVHFNHRLITLQIDYNLYVVFSILRGFSSQQLTCMVM